MEKLFKIPAGMHPKKGMRLYFHVNKKGYLDFKKQGSVLAKDVKYEQWGRLPKYKPRWGV